MNPRLKDMNVEILFEAVLRLQSMEECYNFFDDLCTVQE
ncbi:MAG: TrpR-like protein, YerC/YecD, partial [Oscillospiraceae bacterium]|nr:TrpR-like protein, YerC/YecD [Oscillospiraceae bacterium]